MKQTPFTQLSPQILPCGPSQLPSSVQDETEEDFLRVKFCVFGFIDFKIKYPATPTAAKPRIIFVCLFIIFLFIN